MSDKYLEALRRFADAGDLPMARSVFGSMEQRGVDIGPEHLELLLRANLTGRDAAGARAVVERMQASGMTVDGGVRHDLAITAARSGRLADAVAELDALHAEGVQPSPAQLPELLSIHVRAKRFPAARAVLRRLAHDGRAGRPSDYEKLIEDLHTRKAINDTEAQVEQMIAVGSPPTPDQGRGLVVMIAESGHPERASTLLDRLWSADVAVDVHVLSDILDAHARAGDAESVAATVERMAEVGAEPNAFHRNAMLAARLTAEDVDGAWAMADELLEAGRIPTGENLDGLFDVTLAAGNLQRASGVIDWALILGTPVAPHRVAAAVDGHLQAGELPVARWLFDTTAAAGVPRDRKAARGIVEETIRAGDLDGARALLTELLQTDTLTHGRHWGSLLRALLGATRTDDVVAVVDELNAASTAPAAGDLVRIVHVLLDGGRTADARRITEASLTAGTDVDATNYGELLWLFAKREQVAAVDAIRDHMVAAGVEIEHRHAKAIAHARGEELPDPTPVVVTEPAGEQGGTQDAANAVPTGPGDWEAQIPDAIVPSSPPPDLSPTSAGSTVPADAPVPPVDAPAPPAAADTAVPLAAAPSEPPAAPIDHGGAPVDETQAPVDELPVSVDGSPRPGDGVDAGRLPVAPPTDELPATAPDEANEDALVAAVRGEPAVPVVQEPPGEGPSGPLGPSTVTTDAEQAAGSAPAPADPVDAEDTVAVARARPDDEPPAEESAGSPTDDAAPGVADEEE